MGRRAGQEQPRHERVRPAEAGGRPEHQLLVHRRRPAAQCTTVERLVGVLQVPRRLHRPAEHHVAEARCLPFHLVLDRGDEPRDDLGRMIAVREVGIRPDRLGARR